MMSENAPKRKKHASKKNKKSWRKNTDIEEVEEFLEDKRLEERLGGSFAERCDDQIFVVDESGNGVEDSGENASKRRKRKRAEKPLKCYQHLEITTGVRDPKKGRNPRRLPSQRENPIVVRMKDNLKAQGIIKAKEKAAIENKKLYEEIKAETLLDRNTRRRTEFDFDLWDNSEKHKIEDDPWVNPATKKYIMNINGKYKKVPEDYFEKTSKLPAVEAPLAGSSYNPSLKDHQELLWKAAIKEINKEKDNQKIERQTTMMFPDKKDAPTEETFLKEMSEGLNLLDREHDEPSEQETEGESEAEKKELGNGKKLKTRKKRRKERERRIAEKRLKYELALKAKDQEVFRVKTLKKKIAEQEKLTEERKKKKELMKEQKKNFETLTLGKIKFEEPDLEIKLTDELTGSLRTLKPEGNLLEDRFKSMQKRNIIEPRIGTKGFDKKKKRKKYEKRTYKMGWEKKPY